MRAAAAVLILFMAALLAADSGAGIRWTAPSNWKAEADRPMRLATYQIPPSPGDQEGGECGVYYFGQGQGGSVEANIDRWIGQFRQAPIPGGKDTSRKEKRTIHGLKLTIVDVSGAYTGMGGPRAAPGPPKPDYRMLGAVVEGPQGSVFIKFTGPAKTVARNRDAFEKLLSSLNPQ